MAILSNAAMHCIGQIKTPLKIVGSISRFMEPVCLHVSWVCVTWLSWANELWTLVATKCRSSQWIH